MTDRLRVLCPCCGRILVVDSATGEVLDHRAPGEGVADLDEATRRHVERQARKHDAFGEAMEAERRRKEELAERFRRAAERARDEGESGEGRDEDRWR